VTGFPENQIVETPKLEDIMSLIEQSSSQHAYILATYTAMLEFRDLLAQRQAVERR
jgi:UDP-N-acetylmuramoyl-L-alanyl-D-glutamate--2,6-diaminopimelate ligase